MWLSHDHYKVPREQPTPQTPELGNWAEGPPLPAPAMVNGLDNEAQPWPGSGWLWRVQLLSVEVLLLQCGSASFGCRARGLRDPLENSFSMATLARVDGQEPDTPPHTHTHIACAD